MFHPARLLHVACSRYSHLRMDFSSFQPPLWAATVMNAFTRPWCIAGGWAIDLWLGRPTRDHGDVEIAVLREDQMDLRDFLQDGAFYVATPAGRKRWRDRQMLLLPIHELHVHLGSHELEVLLNESTELEWIYRRDARIRLPIDDWVLRGGFGIPVIAPEVALLYKAKHHQAKDDLDLRSCLESLDENRRDWLARAIALTIPHHPWLDEFVQGA